MALAIQSGTVFQTFTPFLRENEVRQRTVKMTLAINTVVSDCDNPSLPALKAMAYQRVFMLL